MLRIEVRIKGIEQMRSLNLNKHLVKILRLLVIGGFKTKRRHIGSDEIFTQSVTRAHSSYEVDSEDVSRSWQVYLEPLSPGELQKLKANSRRKSVMAPTLNQ